MATLSPSAVAHPAVSPALIPMRPCPPARHALWKISAPSRTRSIRVQRVFAQSEKHRVSSQVDTAFSPTNAKDAVNFGLELYKKGKVRDALAQFDAALTMNPAPEEAQAALYNKACCHASREEGALAQAALREALGKFDLKFSIILSDPDMASFRALPEFKELAEEARKGGDEVGSTFRRDLKLITEVQSPFRGVRKFLYLALIAAAGIATLFTLPALIGAIKGGEGAPGLLPTLGNLAVNIGGGGALLALLLWDQRKEEEQIERVSRDETLSRLPLRLQSGRVVELVQLRQSTRPIILAGKKETVNRALQKAERYRTQLLERGVLLIPLIWQDSSASSLLPKKKGFVASKKASGSAVGDGGADTLEEFERRAKEAASKRVAEVEKKFKAEPVSPGEWEQWLRSQQEAEEGVNPGEDVFVVLRLDGRVRKSGKGMPDWPDLVNELPTLDALVSRLEK